MTQAEVEQEVRRFEGLVKHTASQIVAGGVELEFDDVRQLLRVKVWRAVVRFDARRAAEGRFFSAAHDKRGRTPLERFVFMCVTNMRKDIEKRPRRFHDSINELRDDRRHSGAREQGQHRADEFDGRYLSVDAEQVYAEVEEPADVPLPSTLTRIERQVIALRLEGRMYQQIDRELGLSRAQRERVMRSVREKLADWIPNAPEPRSAPMQPLPGAAPRPARARASLAA